MKVGMKIIGTFFILSLVLEAAFSMPRNHFTIVITVLYKKSPRLTAMVVCDNTKYEPRLETAWGIKKGIL